MSLAYPRFKLVNCSMSCYNSCILTCIYISQVIGKKVCGHIKSRLQFTVIHTANVFSGVTKAEVNDFLKFPCFLVVFWFVCCFQSSFHILVYVTAEEL